VTDTATLVAALELAREFHDAYERLAPSFGYETRPDTKEFDPDSPNGKLMIAVCSEIGSRLQSTNAELNRVVDEAEHKLRMVVSHASGGHLDLAERPLSLNDICVEISQHHNRIYQGGKDAAHRQSMETMK
jgi:hypothetical protein